MYAGHKLQANRLRLITHAKIQTESLPKYFTLLILLFLSQLVNVVLINDFCVSDSHTLLNSALFGNQCNARCAGKVMNLNIV